MDADIHDHLLDVSKRDYPKLHSLITNNGILCSQSKQQQNFFDFLARTIVGQQLSANAARTIWSKLLRIAEVSGCDVYTLFHHQSHELLKSCGLSTNKLKAICNLQQAIDQGFLSREEILDCDYDEVVTKITSLWGLGRWSADMVAIFYCSLPDIFPENDSAVSRGIKAVCNTDNISPVNIAEHFRPYRSYLCLHIWRGLDTGYISKSL